jgi:hypothetical protein
VDWTALATCATALVAAAAALYARNQVKEARTLREEQAQPFVVVDFEPSPAWRQAINLVVENIGKTLATNVRITFDKPLESTETHPGFEISESVLLTEGIPCMPPGKRVTALFDLAHQRKDSGLPMTYVATVEFCDGRGRQQKALTYVLDLNFYYGLMSIDEYGMHHAAKALGEIHKIMKKWTGHHGRLGIDSFDADYAAWRANWERERGGPPTFGRSRPAGRRAPTKFRHLQEPLAQRVFWAFALPVVKRRAARAERREDLRLARAGRHDLVLARRRARGEE